MKRIDDIKEYLHGNRKGKAANRMEREALSDPFLFEALEGLTSTPGDPLDGLIRLERQLNERSRSSRKQKRTWMYIAASFAILLACGTWWFTRQEKTFDVPVMVVAQLSDSVKTKERAILTLESGNTIDLFDKTDSLTVPPGDKKQLLRSDNRAVRKKDSVREMVMEELADQEVSLASVQIEDTSRLVTRKMKVNDNHVSGIITDGKGNPLAGVTVLLSGSTMGVVSDANGHFSLDLPTPEGLLTFSFVGMKSQHILVKAGDKLQVKMEENAEKMTALRDRLIEGLLTIPHSKLNGDRTKRLPGNVNFCFEGIEGESLLLMLDMKGIAASSGSACTSGSLDPSHVLLAIGLPHEIAHGSLRLTLNEEITKEDIDYVVDQLKTIVSDLRGMSPLYEDFAKKQNK